MTAQVSNPPQLPISTPVTPFEGDLLRALMLELGNHAQRLNNSLNEDGSEPMTGPLRLVPYTTTTLPKASDSEGGLIYVKNGTQNKRLAISDGKVWRFPDGNTVS